MDPATPTNDISVCPSCGYKLDGLTVAADGKVTCPECGGRIDRQPGTQWLWPVFPWRIAMVPPIILVVTELLWTWLSPSNLRYGLELVIPVLAIGWLASAVLCPIFGASMHCRRILRRRGPVNKWVLIDKCVIRCVVCWLLHGATGFVGLPIFYIAAASSHKLHG